MNLMTSETTSQAVRAASQAETISYAIGQDTLGHVLVARSVAGVCAILIGADRDELEEDIASRFPKAKLVANEAAVQDDLTKIIRFVDKPADGLDLPLDLRGTPFQRRAWEMLRTVLSGTTVSYSDLARQLGMPTSARAIASACAANPIALAIPCHRVVRSNGDLAGYRCGKERKRQLIRMEAIA
jgi:AraC family transcriptional regulator of adaptative response/methylated-DNA-[protein]-cysteine methyltransferase